MDKISTILVPFDFSDSAERALEYAIGFVGQDDNVKIILAHVSDQGASSLPSDKMEKIREKYNKAYKNKLEWTIRSGTLIEALVEIQKTSHIDLIIMGTYGTNKEGGEVQTNTSKLVLEADCPVLVVPRNHKGFHLKNIALVLGNEEIDNIEDLSTMLEVARRFNARVHVVTIENKPGDYGYSEAEAKNEKAMAYYLENFYAERVFLKNKDVVDGILTYASKRDLDLIAILPRNHTLHSEPSEGQLTQMLTLHSKVPVLAVD